MGGFVKPTIKQMLNATHAPMMKFSNHVQSIENVNMVYKTKDLSMFKSISGNRNVNLQHVRRLVDSISKNGMLCSPIIVNEHYEVVDGQHRLLAAKELKCEIYFIIMAGYRLQQVQNLNLNQKNWSKNDFMEGYASMGVIPYVKLKTFVQNNDDFTFNDCMALCSNKTTGANDTAAHKYRKDYSNTNQSQIFEEGTWKGKDFELAQHIANKIRMIKTYYEGYNRSAFVGTMIGLMLNKQFDFNEFMHKLRLQPTALVDCATREQYKTLIEDIYNYKRRDKISFKYS